MDYTYGSSSSAHITRPRRLRTTPAMRALVSETSLEPRHLILPAFIADGLTEPAPIESMPGVKQHTFDSLAYAIEEAIELGVGGIMLFGVPKPEDKDPLGTHAIREDGILNRALRFLYDRFGDATLLMADTCLDEFTDHGHCGIVDAQGKVANDETVAMYAQEAVSQARAGAHIVAPSGMMDGQIGSIRAALDAEGYRDTAIMAYSAKYASAFYGPFRSAVQSSLQGDRKTYQQDPGNRRESLLETQLDIAQGADIVMVKPAMSFLDVLSDVAHISPVPVAAYQVSGEYSMICAASERGWVDRDAIAQETVLSIRRAGANIVLTYFAVDIARRLQAR